MNEDVETIFTAFKRHWAETGEVEQSIHPLDPVDIGHFLHVAGDLIGNPPGGEEWLKQANLFEFGARGGELIDLIAPFVKSYKGICFTDPALCHAQQGAKDLTNVQLRELKKPQDLLEELRTFEPDIFISRTTFQHMPDFLLQYFLKLISIGLRPGARFNAQIDWPPLTRSHERVDRFRWDVLPENDFRPRWWQDFVLWRRLEDSGFSVVASPYFNSECWRMVKR